MVAIPCRRTQYWRNKPHFFCGGGTTSFSVAHKKWIISEYTLRIKPAVYLKFKAVYIEQS
jgi:hypothetical protein